MSCCAQQLEPVENETEVVNNIVRLEIRESAIQYSSTLHSCNLRNKILYVNFLLTRQVPLILKSSSSKRSEAVLLR